MAKQLTQRQKVRQLRQKLYEYVNQGEREEQELVDFIMGKPNFPKHWIKEKNTLDFL